MNKTKSIIAVLIHVALAIFILMTLWPALNVSNDGYSTKTSGVVVNQPVEEVVEPEIPTTEEPEIMEPELEVSEPEMPVVDDMAESEPVMPEVVAPEVVDEVAPAVEPAPTTESVVHEVKAQVTAFSPLVIFIQPGDLVAWSNMNGHDTQSIEGLVPDGAEAWHSKLGEDYQRAFTVEGVYLYKCTPHWGTGMGGVIVVGNPTNFEAILASGQKGAAKRLVKKAAAAIAAQGL